MLNEQKFFDELIGLGGKQVQLALQSDGKSYKGVVTNVMFDSFILETDKEKMIVAFNDLSYLDPLSPS